MVELALVMTVCFWILLGIVDFGRVYYFYAAATNAAWEGARYWASNNSATTIDVKNRVTAEGSPQVTIDPTLVTLSTTGGDRIVQVQFRFSAITPMISGLWGGGPLTVTTAARMPSLAGTG